MYFLKKGGDIRGNKVKKKQQTNWNIPIFEMLRYFEKLESQNQAVVLDILPNTLVLLLFHTHTHTQKKH